MRRDVSSWLLKFRRLPSTRSRMCAVGRVAHADESAGKHKSGKTRKGTRWLRTALIEAAAGASRA